MAFDKHGSIEVQQLIVYHLNQLKKLAKEDETKHLMTVNFITFLVLNYSNTEEKLKPIDAWVDFNREVEENGFRTINIGY